MNPFPTIPTDNLYKFMALSGLWILFGILALMILLIYQIHENEKFTKKQSTIYTDQSSIREYTRRINSISAGKTSENLIPYISDHFKKIKDELSYEKDVVKSNQDEIKRFSTEIKNRPASIFRSFESLSSVNETYTLITFVTLYLSGCILAIIGFRNWRKIQLVANEIQKCDLELKRLQLAYEKRPRIKVRK